MAPVPALPDTLHPLQPFARSSEGPVRALAASVTRDDEAGLRFRYVLEGDIDTVRIPALSVARPTDELWKHTCFEAFIASDGEEYRELNFSPSTEWAAYSFASYRKGMAPVALASSPRIEVTRSGTQLIVEVRVASAGLLPESWRAPGARLRISLTAVIEDTNGRIAYWALKHAPDKPDFHHSAGFILEV
jgi:hypothetical protein